MPYITFCNSSFALRSNLKSKIFGRDLFSLSWGEFLVGVHYPFWPYKHATKQTWLALSRFFSFSLLLSLSLFTSSFMFLSLFSFCLDFSLLHFYLPLSHSLYFSICISQFLCFLYIFFLFWSLVIVSISFFFPSIDFLSMSISFFLFLYLFLFSLSCKPMVMVMTLYLALEMERMITLTFVPEQFRARSNLWERGATIIVKI